MLRVGLRGGGWRQPRGASSSGSECARARRLVDDSLRKQCTISSNERILQNAAGPENATSLAETMLEPKFPFDIYLQSAVRWPSG